MFTNNDPPSELPPDPEGPEAHMLGPLTEEEPPLMGLVGDITEEAAQQMAMSLLGFNGGKIMATKEDLEDDDDPHQMAVEWFEYNVIGAWISDTTPLYIKTL